MSDFTSVFWDYFIAIITVVRWLGCGVFLWSQRQAARQGRRRPGSGHHRARLGRRPAGIPQPLPRWWMWLFYITVVFSVVYLILYPGLGTQFKGVFNWTSAREHQDEVKAAEAKYGPLFAST